MEDIVSTGACTPRTATKGPTSRVLVVEDESTIADAVLYALRAQPFYVVILDVGLPDISGFELCRELRQFSEVPVVFLTARDGEVDRVVGLELGADDASPVISATTSRASASAIGAQGCR